MSVMTPPWTSTDSRDRGEHIGMDAWNLCAEFIDRLLSDAQVTAGPSPIGQMAPNVDWDRIWRAGEGAPSEEAAIGRVVSEAWLVAREIASGTAVSPTIRPEDAGLTLAAETDREPPQPIGREPSLQPERTTARTDALLVVTEPAADESVAHREPVAPLEDPVTAREERVGSLDGPVAGTTDSSDVVEVPMSAPLLAISSAAGSVTLDRPEDGVVAVAEPAEDEQLLRVRTETAAPAPEGEAAQRVVRRHSGWFRFFTWLEVIGAIMILFVVWQLWGTSIAQGQAQESLKSQFDALRAHHHPPKSTAAGPSLIAAGVRIPPPADGSVVAELQIPAIGVDQYVVEGTTTDDLSKGPGHYTGTAAPGQAGNVAIAGHRTTHGAPFNRLGDLRTGDRIILTTTSGESLTYIVAGTPNAVSPSDVAVLNYFGDNRITLTTCNPEFSSTQRLIAVGELKQASSKPAKLPEHITYHVSNTGTNSWVWSLLPVVGIEVCLLVLLGMTYRRFDFWFGRVGRWIILVPLWAAGLYLLFDTLTKFLPASV